MALLPCFVKYGGCEILAMCMTLCMFLWKLWIDYCGILKGFSMISDVLGSPKVKLDVLHPSEFPGLHWSYTRFNET